MPMPTMDPRRLARYEALYTQMVREPDPEVAPFLHNPRLLPRAHDYALVARRS